MDCRDAQFYLRLRRHATDELGADVTGPLNSHLAECAGCAGAARALESFDRAVSAAMKDVPVPPRLRERLVAHLSEQRGAQMRRKAYRGLAALAASVLVVCLALGAFDNTRPKLDTDLLVQRNE
ncbi:MAG: hypothetical protein K2V38_20695, partial [Gemmataceae bacterium]|nr:hypothetical protein [Gemmataceae bacterium]